MPAADKRQRKKENARRAREEREAAEKRRKQIRLARNVGIVVALFVILVVTVNYVTDGSSKKKASPTTSTTTPTTAVAVSKPDFALDPGKTYTATITTNMGDIAIKMDTAKAPVGAGHFIKLAKAGFYNNTPINRAVKDFVIQGGDPKGQSGDCNGQPSVIAEVPTDNYPVGALAAAKTGNAPPGTFDCQFFIVTGSQGATLPNDYARFGSVSSGMDVVKKIEALAPPGSGGAPTQKVTVEKVTITES